MRNPNAPWEIANDIARKRWLARGRRPLTWREHVARDIVRGVAHNLVTYDEIGFFDGVVRESHRRLYANAAAAGEPWLVLRWEVPE